MRTFTVNNSLELKKTPLLFVTCIELNDYIERIPVIFADSGYSKHIFNNPDDII